MEPFGYEKQMADSFSSNTNQPANRVPHPAGSQNMNQHLRHSGSRARGIARTLSALMILFLGAEGGHCRASLSLNESEPDDTYPKVDAGIDEPSDPYHDPLVDALYSSKSFDINIGHNTTVRATHEDHEHTRFQFQNSSTMTIDLEILHNSHSTEWTGSLDTNSDGVFDLLWRREFTENIERLSIQFTNIDRHEIIERRFDEMIKHHAVESDGVFSTTTQPFGPSKLGAEIPSACELYEPADAMYKSLPRGGGALTVTTQSTNGLHCNKEEILAIENALKLAWGQIELICLLNTTRCLQLKMGLFLNSQSGVYRIVCIPPHEPSCVTCTDPGDHKILIPRGDTKDECQLAGLLMHELFHTSAEPTLPGHDDNSPIDHKFDPIYGCQFYCVDCLCKTGITAAYNRPLNQFCTACATYDMLPSNYDRLVAFCGIDVLFTSEACIDDDCWSSSKGFHRGTRCAVGRIHDCNNKDISQSERILEAGENHALPAVERYPHHQCTYDCMSPEADTIAPCSGFPQFRDAYANGSDAPYLGCDEPPFCLELRP